MGLLTDRKRQVALGKTILQNQSKLFPLIYFGAIVASYFIFPEQSVSNVIGMHENAAAPGHAASMATAEDMQHVVKYVDEFEKIRKNVDINKFRKFKPKVVITVHMFIQKELEAAGYIVANQSYTHRDPITNEVKTGTNLYATHWSHRSDRTEAYLLHAPTIHSTNTALALGLARYIPKHEIMSRNLIVLFTQDEYVGADAFLSVYNRVPTRDGLNAGPLSGARAGDIHSAISLLFNKARMANVVMATTGINGQKPNMDLVQASFICANRPVKNVNLWLAAHENFVEGNYSIMQRSKGDRKKAARASRLLTLFESAKLAGSCNPDGGHAIFLKHGIEAVTFRASNARGDKKLHVAPFKLVEGVFRVLNNLVQKFNQCFYFYLHVDGARSHYLPFTVYIVPLLACCIVLILRALCIWYGHVPAGEAVGAAGGGSSKEEAEKEFVPATTAAVDAAAVSDADAVAPDDDDDGTDGGASTAELWTRDDRMLWPALLLVGSTYFACVAGLLSVHAYLPSIYGQVNAAFQSQCARYPGGNLISQNPTVVTVCEADVGNLAAAVTLAFAVAGAWLGHIFFVSALQQFEAGVAAEVGANAEQVKHVLSWELVEAFIDLFASFILGTVTALNAAMAAPAVLIMLPLSAVFSLVAAGSRAHTFAAWAVLLCTSPPALVGGFLYLTAVPANDLFALIVRNHAVFSTWILPVFFGGYLPMYFLALSSATSKRWIDNHC